jgi:hypothetical protein
MAIMLTKPREALRMRRGKRATEFIRSISIHRHGKEPPLQEGREAKADAELESPLLLGRRRDLRKTA